MNAKTIPNQAAPKPADETASQAAAPAPAPAPAAAAAPAKPEDKRHKPQRDTVNHPAFPEPVAKPLVPRDQYHGHGGRFAVIDGKRVPIDEDGKPLPLDSDGMPIAPDQ